MVLYVICAAAGVIVGIVATYFIVATMNARAAARRKAKRMAGPRTDEPPKNKFKLEFSKLLIVLVLLTYFAGVFIGAWIVFIDFSQLGALLAFIGTPTVAAIGFYVWKAKAENLLKLKKENPLETDGISVDLNNINT